MKTLNTISKLTTIISITAAALYVVSVAIENRRLDKEIAPDPGDRQDLRAAG